MAQQVYSEIQFQCTGESFVSPLVGWRNHSMATNPPPENPVAPPLALELPPAVEHRLAQQSGEIFAGGPYQNR